MTVLGPGDFPGARAGDVGQSRKGPRAHHRQSYDGDCLLSSLPPSFLPDLPEISVSHVNLTVREGDNAVITCNGSGSPLPDVDWIVSGLQSINTHQVGVQEARDPAPQS